MKTLFLRDSKLMIRLTEGEFEVSNPEAIFIHPDRERDENETLRIYKFIEGMEWPGGEVEIIEVPDDKGRDMSGPPYPIVDFTPMVKLLPKKEKPDHSNTTPGYAGHNEFHPDDVPHSFTESAYKEVERKKCQFNCVPGYCLSSNAKFKESDCTYNNPDKPVSAPSESQEELWDEIYNNAITWRSQEFNKEYLKRFKITRNP